MEKILELPNKLILKIPSHLWPENQEKDLKKLKLFKEGLVYFYEKKYEAAFCLFSDALVCYKSDSEKRSPVYTRLVHYVACIYILKKDYETSLIYYHKLLKSIMENTTSFYLLPKALFHVGSIYYKKRDYKLSLSYFSILFELLKTNIVEFDQDLHEKAIQMTHRVCKKIETIETSLKHCNIFNNGY